MSGTSFVLADVEGRKLKDRSIPKATLEEAFFRYRVSVQAAVAKQAEEVEADNQAVLLDVCKAFLTHTEREVSASTYDLRRRYLFDLVFGLSEEYLDKTPEELEKLKAAGELRRVHAGYGERRVADLTKLDVSQWCALHPDWTTYRIAIQSVKRCLNWAVEYGFPGVQSNPI